MAICKFIALKCIFLYTHYAMKIFNTYSRKVEEFVPLDPPKVGMYTCGPTVYDHMHIGNLRTFVVSDFWQRVFEWNGDEVKSVMNITDVDDKTIKASIAAVEVLDKEVGRVIEAILKQNGTVFLTADHGNAEELVTFPSTTYYFTTNSGIACIY